MNKAILIDDELHCIETLKEKINLYCPSIEVIETFTKPQLALDYLNQNSIDLVFLDIEMPILNGFSLLEKVESINFKIIFTTAYDQYAIKAIKFSAFDYLLKPIEKNDLIEFSHKIIEKSQKLDIQEQLNILQQQMKNASSDQLKICIPTAENTIFPYLKDILRIESSSNYSIIYFTSAKKIIVSKTLKDFEEMLVPHNFFRVHNSHLVNMSKIVSIEKSEGGSLTLENGDKIEISRRRKDEFFKEINFLNLTL